ncbi:hypothetical protein BDV38DRAFT_51804 [Aspergillus pseudotamarii]|uniref:Uncharacterized protein n=1 Tax=Aspergillus pseudotamarii TaxID=132259 RepID=A0A5N6T159_ASPPS|nr:uncharacterized protein BDV38DRAFT_51804 [Aspergillus pseudotamarii]KAE8139434.1 hypothetical protein BDV38DRAFT_51804 [Aspergillus pseudotamarii]
MVIAGADLNIDFMYPGLSGESKGGLEVVSVVHTNMLNVEVFCGLGLISESWGRARESPFSCSERVRFLGIFFFLINTPTSWLSGVIFCFLLNFWLCLFLSFLFLGGLWLSAYFKETPLGCKGWLYYLSCSNCPCHHCIAVVSLLVVLCLTYKSSVASNKKYRRKSV